MKDWGSFLLLNLLGTLANKKNDALVASLKSYEAHLPEAGEEELL